VTTINFSLPHEGQARLAVYNVAGQLVRTLTDGVLPAGSQSVSWDGRNQAGRSVPGGVYFYRLSTGDRTLTQKAVLVR
jgi:flagellar hook assembly protein FlgD